MLWQFGADVLRLYDETSDLELIHLTLENLRNGEYDMHKARVCSSFSLPGEGTNFSGDSEGRMWSDARLLDRTSGIKDRRAFVDYTGVTADGDEVQCVGELFFTISVIDGAGNETFWAWVHTLEEVVEDDGEGASSFFLIFF